MIVTLSANRCCRSKDERYGGSPTEPGHYFRTEGWGRQLADCETASSQARALLLSGGPRARTAKVRARRRMAPSGTTGKVERKRSRSLSRLSSVSEARGEQLSVTPYQMRRCPHGSRCG